MPKEESKLVEKLEEKQATKKFSDEEIRTVKEIQNEYLKVQNQFGQLAISKIGIVEQEKRLDASNSKVESNFKALQDKERKFLDGITENGDFISNKS